MSDNCEVIAAVTVEGLAFMGESPVPGMYVCAMSGVYFPPSAPLVCGSTAVATAVGKWATTPAAQGVIEKAIELGCNLAVEVGERSTKFLLVKKEQVSDRVSRGIYQAEKTYQAINTVDGIHWLMRYLTGRP